MKGITNAAKGVTDSATIQYVDNAVASEATLRDTAVKNEASARKDADDAEIADRKAAVTAEAKARAEDITAEQKARSAGDTNTLASAKSYAESYTNSHKGYTVITSTSGIKWNCELRLGTLSANVSITLPDLTSTILAETAEIRVIFREDTTIRSVSITPPSGWTLKWPDDAPSPESGHLYEVSLAPIESGTNKTIVGYYRDIQM